MFNLSGVAALCAMLVLVLAVEVSADPPWRRRRRPGVLPNRQAAARVHLADWPSEPESPQTIDAGRFAAALRTLCGFMPRGRQATYANWILESSAEFGEDPFLIAALIFRQSRCRSTAEDLGGVGLSLIPRSMYSATFRRGVYRFHEREAGVWQERELHLARYPFAEPRLRRARENIYFTAGLLSMWRRAHHSIDPEFEQAPHRHHLSHFVWGDRVLSARAEDRVFTDRRRFLQYYGAVELPAPIAFEGLALGSPLDGAPRVVSSWIGNERDGGARSHRGVDVESVFGEPVRVIADGRVVFAGIDLPGRRTNRQMRPSEIADVPRRELGRGGRFVCIRHQRTGLESIRSCYMHLETVEVRQGEIVVRGQQIGTVGRTGMRTSAPHLHLEMHDASGLIDASAALAGILIGHPPEPVRRRTRRRRR